MIYIKRPLIVEAEQYKEGFIPPFESKGAIYHYDVENKQLLLETLNGSVIINDGEWVIKGIKGEFYPCKSDIFDASYELME